MTEWVLLYPNSCYGRLERWLAKVCLLCDPGLWTRSFVTVLGLLYLSRGNVFWVRLPSFAWLLSNGVQKCDSSIVSYWISEFLLPCIDTHTHTHTHTHTQTYKHTHTLLNSLPLSLSLPLSPLPHVRVWERHAVPPSHPRWEGGTACLSHTRTLTNTQWHTIKSWSAVWRTATTSKSLKSS